MCGVLKVLFFSNELFHLNLFSCSIVVTGIFKFLIFKVPNPYPQEWDTNIPILSLNRFLFQRVVFFLCR